MLLFWVVFKLYIFFSFIIPVLFLAVIFKTAKVVIQEYAWGPFVSAEALEILKKCFELA